MKPQSLQDIERAAWFARLAFGAYTAQVNPPKPAPAESDRTFQVLP